MTARQTDLVPLPNKIATLARVRFARWQRHARTLAALWLLRAATWVARLAAPWVK